MSNPDLHTIKCHHEAGHAVVARRLGISIEGISMAPDDDSDARVPIRDVETWLARDAEMTVLLSALCKFGLAGALAQLRFDPDDDRKEQLRGGQASKDYVGDINKIRPLVAEVVLLTTGVCSSRSETKGVPADRALCEQLLGQLCDETEALVAENWPAIQRIARYLQRHREMTEAEVDALL